MKKYLKEIIFQAFMFYLFPFFIIKFSPISMVFILISVTFILSMILGIKEKKKIKYLYPIIVSLLFIPTVFIHYNESALIHSLWYFIVSFIGVILGTLLIKK